MALALVARTRLARPVLCHAQALPTLRSTAPSFIRSSCRPINLAQRSFHQSHAPCFSLSRILKATHWDTVKSGVPPPRGGERGRRAFNRLPQSAVVYGIAGLNVVVFMGWYYAKAEYEMRRDVGPWQRMQANFVASWHNVVDNNRYWTVLTSCFSHNSASHILFNGFTYAFMAPTVATILGNNSFVALYLSAGVISSAVSIWWHGKEYYGSHGASGAIYSVVSFFACFAPRATFLIFGIVPCPAWAFVAGIFGFDLYRSVTEAKTNTDTVGHVAGLTSGMLYFLLWRMRGGRGGAF